MVEEIRTQRYRTEDVQSDAGSFNDLLLPQHLVQALSAAGFSRPSPVQKAAIPVGRVGTDLIVQAKSGTGKTAVFATILLDRVDMELNTPQAIVLAPTRELAIQSFQVIDRIAAGLPQPGPSAAVFVGGLPTADDEKRLRRVCHIAVGSPGRLCGLVTSGALLVGKIKAVVLDEADQLLSEGFYADTAWLLQQLPKRKQVLAFSATYTPELLADLEPLMKRPQKVLLCEETVSLLGIRQFYKLVGDAHTTSTSVSTSTRASDVSSCADVAGKDTPHTAVQAAKTQSSGTAEEGTHVEHTATACGCPSHATEAAAPTGQQQQQQQQANGTAGDTVAAGPKLTLAEQEQLLMLKVDALLQLLSSVSFHQAVVFCNRKPSAEWLARRLTAAGCPSAHLSSDLPQTERMAAMESVRGFKVRVIVSTDVMARGVDFDRVNLVVNVDLPPDAATYVHRVGRTGRFGSRGIAVALVSHNELHKLQQYLTSVKGGDMSPLPELIPSDLYSFELTSDWEKDAYKQLLAAPTSTPPDSPPPLRKKKLALQQQQGLQDATSDTAAASAAAAALSAFGYDESALSCFDWEDEEGVSEVQTTVQQQQQPPSLQQQQSAAGGSSEQAGVGSAAENATYDPAAAWEAWAAYYRSLGYEYDHTNPYLQPSPASAAAVAGDSTAGHQQQQQLQVRMPAAAGVLAVQATGSTSGAAAVEGVEPQLPQHQVLYEVQDEFEGEDGSDVGDEDGWELPDEDEIDDKARLLLSRLHVTQQAAAIAAGVSGAAAQVDSTAAAEAAAEATVPSALAGAVVGQALQPLSAVASPALGMGNTHGQQHRQQPPADNTAVSVASMHQHASQGPLCWECWSAGYTAWQQQYTAWQQQFSAWREQYQSQQQQQWQQYSSWCDSYVQQQQQQDVPRQTGLSES